MTLVVLEGVARRFGDQQVLEGCGLQVEKGDRLGLVGENGCGKTTLLRIIADLDRPDEGTRRTARGLQVAMAEQIPVFGPAMTVRQAAVAGLREVGELAQELDSLHEELAVHPEDRVLHVRLARAQERFDHLGGHSLHHRAEEMLCGLGFRVADLDRPVDSLSGGEKSRVQLAGVLLAKADLLLLDEPTNHLDLAGIDFLEGLLRSGGYTFIVVSHDRAFLDAVATGILDIQAGKVLRWRGNFSAYARIREMELERQFKEWQRQQELIARQEDFYRRYHVGQRSREAKGRMRRLQRMEVLNRPPAPRGKGPRWRWEAEGPQQGYQVLRTEALAVGPVPDLVLLEQVEVRVQTGERIGIVGPNGCGKTTLLRVLAGRLVAGGGVVERHPKASLAWFDQEIKGLVPGATVLQNLRAQTGPKVDDEELRSHLALFLFSGDEVDKQVDDLSGGEARRLLLACLTWEPAGLLCLDEPTNHLDIGARESLEQALVSSGATVLFVSHDRFFLEKVATQIWFLEPPAVRVFPGSWSQACRLKESRDRQAPRERQARPRSAEGAAARPRAARKVNTFKLEQLEERIFAREGELEEARASQASPEVYQDHRLSREVAARITALEEELARLYEEWEEMGG